MDFYKSLTFRWSVSVDTTIKSSLIGKYYREEDLTFLDVFTCEDINSFSKQLRRIYTTGRSLHYDDALNSTWRDLKKLKRQCVRLEKIIRKISHINLMIDTLPLDLDCKNIIKLNHIYLFKNRKW